MTNQYKDKPYNDYGQWIRQRFPFRVQKISVDAGFSCPNRDGTISHGGCIFCDNRTFNPSYCQPSKSIAQQMEEGKAFFRRKYPDMKYLAYFQAYSNTYAPLDVLNRRTFLIVEYGIESVNDDTLRHINRGHDFECSRRAIELTHDRGILTGGHIILGLPGEDREENIRQASIVSDLKLDILKIHQLQIIRGTQLADEYTQRPFKLFTPDEYIDTCIAYLERLRSDIIVERFVSQSPADMLIAPKWGIKNHEFTNRLVNRMKELDTWQGAFKSKRVKK